MPLEHLKVRPIVPRNNGATTSRHSLPSTALFAQQPSQQVNDYRRALPSGVSLSAFGNGGVRKSSQDAEGQQNATATFPAPKCTCQAGAGAKLNEQQQSGGSEASKEDSSVKSSPPVLATALRQSEQDLPDGLPRLGPVSAEATTANKQSASGGDSQGSAAAATMTEEDVLPDAASGLLSLARG